ncbi:MAG: hypothetical protein ACFE95_09770 [Candidatus Hodarchaeota archaeon]
MNHRWTIEELETSTDLEIIEQCLADRKSSCTNYYSPLYTKLKELQSKVNYLISKGETTIGRELLEGFFHITSVHREDIASAFDQVTAKNISDISMKNIASYMADAYCEMCFRNDLESIAKKYLTDDMGSPMKVISNGDYVMIYELQNGNLLVRATNEAKDQYGNNGDELLKDDVDTAFFDTLLEDHEFEILEKNDSYFIITNEMINETGVILEDQELEDAPCYINHWWYCKKGDSIQSIFENGLTMILEYRQ